MAEKGYCVPCLQNGHKCETDYRDPLSNKFVCVFCDDGERCPRWTDRPQPQPTQKEAEPMAEKCQCKPDCEATPQSGRQYAWGHKPKQTKSKRTPPKGVVWDDDKPAARPTKAPAKDEPQPIETKALRVTQDQVTRMFLAWPFEDQIGAVQNWLDRA